MKRALVLSISLALTLTAGCKKEPAESSPKEAAKPQQGTAPAPGPEAKGTVTPAPDKPAPDKATPDKPAPDKPQVKQVAPKALPRVEAKALPAAPDDNIILVARRANTECKAGDGSCKRLLELASKMEAEPEQAADLLKSGTDQAKAAIVAALRFARNPKLDPMLASVLVRPNGSLNEALLSHAVNLRAAAAVPVLKKELGKASGLTARQIIGALGRISLPEATAALGEALNDPKLSPFRGEICTALARHVAKGNLERITELGKRLDASPRQSEGCRSAEAALKVLGSAGDLVLNVGQRRVRPAAVLAYQQKGEAHHVRVNLYEKPTTCGQAATPLVSFKVPLDRAGQPLNDVGVTPSMSLEAQDLGHNGVYLFRLQELALETGKTFKGDVFATQAVPGKSRVVLSGPFSGTWCGVAP